MTPNLNLYPPEGYSFRDARAGEITGGNWPEVINKLRAYRVRAGLPVGKPEEEVFEQFCGRHPDYCRRGGASPGSTVRVAVKAQDFPYTVMNWLAATFTDLNRGKIKTVSMEEAARRAMICANCHRQTVWRTGCMGCNKNIHVLINEVMKTRKETPVSRGLQGCVAFGDDVRLAVHLDQKTKPVNEKPPHCWR